MARSNGRRKGASLYDFRDLDLMLKIEERGDDEGWSPTADLASSFGFGDELQSLGIRLAWMRQYGMVERRNEKPGSSWRLTQGGVRVVEAKLRAASMRELQALPEEAMIEVMANITARYHQADPMTAHMLRREFAYGTHPR